LYDRHLMTLLNFENGLLRNASYNPIENDQF